MRAFFYVTIFIIKTNTMNFFKNMLSSEGKVSSKRFVTFVCLLFMLIGYTSNLFWDFTIDNDLFQSLQWQDLGLQLQRISHHLRGLWVMTVQSLTKKNLKLNKIYRIKKPPNKWFFFIYICFVVSILVVLLVVQRHVF